MDLKDRRNSLAERHARIQMVLKQILQQKELAHKMVVLDRQPEVLVFFRPENPLFPYLESLPLEREYVVKSIAVIGEANNLFFSQEPLKDSKKLFSACLDSLLEVEKFYDTIGGILGYHLKVLELLLAGESAIKAEQSHHTYFMPQGFDLTHSTPEKDKFVRLGIESLPGMGEIYPVGGAGDRFNLLDEMTGEMIPVAMLPFGGRSLLSDLIRDLQAKEYLYFKLFHKQICIPVAMMTSHEKRNHEHILRLCQSRQWFGRGVDSFKFFTQELVPVVTEEGRWVVKEPLKPLMKPGGHGVIWKEAADEGVFDWFKRRGVAKLLVRQINNPMAGVDDGILAFIGLGYSENKSFGFASCARLVGAPEGVNVLAEKVTAEGYDYSITNIEYTEFSKKGIVDQPREPESRYSAYPANTNILFADIEDVQRALLENPIPGVIINLKPLTAQSESTSITVKAGRLESTMQNIADEIVDHFSSRQSGIDGAKLKTYMTYNSRRKTISVTKTEHEKGKEIHGTPLGCYYDMQANHHELLTRHCHMQLPKMQSEADFLRRAPHPVTIFHPALGPCWEIIGQKIRGGKLESNSELQLEVADVNIEGLTLHGSLIVHAEDPLGETDAAGLLHYGARCGKCTLKNVTVDNRGIDYSADNCYWKNVMHRHEVVRIVLHGHAEFYAENVTISGSHTIEVRNGYRVTAYEESGQLCFLQEKIDAPSWSWHYHFDAKNKIKLTLV